MLKALQLRINNLTRGLDRHRRGMKPDDVAEQSNRLAARQSRTSRLAKDLAAKLKADSARGGGV
jgi:hypothetical protein